VGHEYYGTAVYVAWDRSEARRVNEAEVLVGHVRWCDERWRGQVEIESELTSEMVGDQNWLDTRKGACRV
jgi:hypothetical protein